VGYPTSGPPHRGGDPRACRRCGAIRQGPPVRVWKPTPQAYVDTLRAVFAQVHRVLVDTGTLWLNLGDTYGRLTAGAVRA